MACHIRIANSNAKFGLPEVRLGIIPGFGGTQRLTQLIGKGKAMELLMTADTIDAVQAKELRLINHIVQSTELIEKSKVYINKIASMAPFAVAQVIQCVHAFDKEGQNGFEKERIFNKPEPTIIYKTIPGLSGYKKQIGIIQPKFTKEERREFWE